MPVTALQACIAKGINYIDVADDRDFVCRAYALAESSAMTKGMVVLIGCSVVPGLTSLLTRFAQATVPRIVQAKICISPGTKHPRGAGSFACLLSTVGQKFTAPAGGNEASVAGWTKPELVNFPAPLGNRTCYRVVDIADHFIQPRYFRTETVEFRIGSELRTLNFLLSAVREIRQAITIPVTWLIPISRAFIHIAAPFGSTAGGVIVKITGYAGEERRTETWCVFSGKGAERIPSIPAAIAANMVLRGTIRGTGIVPPPDWITQDQLVAELAARDIRVAVRSGDREWRVVN
jgi:saccharopine dehydrogenase-like NADP-dependent oxidoreductase